MKSATRIWLAFAACAVLLAAGLAWLTAWTLRLERDRAAAQRELEAGRNALALEEKINSAFWRVDSLMALLIGQEAARDPADYEPFLPFGVSRYGKDPAMTPQPSPLLEPPSDLVRLHFQLRADGSLTSPQVPAGSQCEMAVSCGANPEQIASRSRLLDEARQFAAYEPVSFLCPSAGNSPTTGTAPWVAGQLRPAPLGNNASRPLANPLWWSSSDEALQAVPDAATSENNFVDRATSAGQLVEKIDLAATARDNRSRAIQSQNAMLSAQQSMEYQIADSPVAAEAVGLMRPVWLDNELVLVRAVKAGNETRLQCCWLDWEQLQEFLRGELADLFAEIRFVPGHRDQPINPARTLTTLPVELEFPAEHLPAAKPGSTRANGGLWPALLAAGFTSLLAVAALGTLLAGVLRLSERRATFVSAVSHELRTPLTTFRLYSEMLADGVVTDPARQSEYLQTLHTEAERLGHLVDNVLDYAGLERHAQPGVLQLVSVRELVQRIAPVLRRLAGTAGRPLVEALEPAALDSMVKGDPAALERVLVNLVDNAIKYGGNPAQPEIIWTVNSSPRHVSLSIRDFGPGIAAHDLRRIFTPFSRGDTDSAGQTPGVGLGLALCQRIAQKNGGKLVAANQEPGSEITLSLKRGGTPA